MEANGYSVPEFRAAMVSSRVQSVPTARNELEPTSANSPAWLQLRAKDRSCGIILVGPGRHFGLELILKFVAGGCRVGVITASEAALAELSGQLAAFPDDVVLRQADASKAQDFGRVLNDVAEKLGRVDGLIYNPKYGEKGSVLMVEPAALDHAMSVNVTGAIVAIQALLPYLRMHRGRVILTGGGYKDHPDAGKLALSVGKAGLHGLFKALRDPLRHEGVEVSTIVIDGVVRRRGQFGAAAGELADFYWDVFTHRPGRVHRFPPRTAEGAQLSLFP